MLKITEKPWNNTSRCETGQFPLFPNRKIRNADRFWTGGNRKPLLINYQK